MSEDNTENESMNEPIDDTLSGAPTENVNKNDSNIAETNKKVEKQKIDILLKPTGNAPIMKKKRWSVDADKPIGWVVEFIKKYLKLDSQERLFLYINQTFAPSPDQIMKNLYDCYSTEGKLVLHYCKTQAWG